MCNRVVGISCPSHQFLGLWIEVPGMGSGSCDLAKADLRIRLIKSAYCINSLEGCPLPGMISPIVLPCCCFTNLRDSAKSLSLDTTTAQSYLPSQESFRR